MPCGLPPARCTNDSSDPAKLASVPNQTAAAGRMFIQNVWVADIVTVNGKPVRGTYVDRMTAAGQDIAGINRNGDRPPRSMKLQLELSWLRD